jgi:hypothetical protein
MEYQKLKKTIKDMDYVWYDELCKLNIIAVRENYIDDNTFKDKIYIAYKTLLGVETVDEADITTLPGWYWLKNPMNKNGCGILKPGQYIDVYKIGKHFEQDALMQCGKFNVWRDNNRDTVLDLINEESGIQMANLHHADGITHTVDKWSALCQVYQSTLRHNKLMINARQQVKQTKHDRFTYTLIMRDDIK